MDIEELCAQVGNALEEVRYLRDNVIEPTWSNEKYHGFHNTLYGLIMRYFALIDVCSVYEYGANNQTGRMEKFLHEKLDYEPVACQIAVKLWRHTLMHQASPSALLDKSKKVEFYWLLHWDEKKLGDLKHMTFQDIGNRKILNVAPEKWLSDLDQIVMELKSSLSKEQISTAKDYFKSENTLKI